MRVALVAALLILASPLAAHAAWLPDGNPVTPPSVQGSTFDSSLPSVADGQGGVYVFHVRTITHPDFTGGSELYVDRLDADGNVPAGWAGGRFLQGWGESYGFTSYTPLTSFRGSPNTAQAALAWDNLAGGEPNTRLVRFTVHADATAPRSLGNSVGGVAAMLPTGDDGVIFAATTQPHAPIGQVPPQSELYLGREDSGSQALWFGLTLALSAEVEHQPVGLAADGADGCYAAWIHTGGSLRLHRALTNSTLSPAFPAGGLAITAANARRPKLVAGPASSVYVLWEDTRSGTARVYLTLMLSSGGPAPGWPLDGIPVGPGTAAEALSECAPDGFGGVLIAFDAPSGSHRLTRFDAAGARHAGWSPTGLVLHSTPSSAAGTALLPDGFGGAFAVYRNGAAGDADRGLYSAHVQGDGSLAPGNPSGGTRLSVEGRVPRLVPSGIDAIATWEDPSDGRIRAQRLSGDGPVAVELSLVSATAEAGAVSLEWQTAAAAATTFTLERRAGRSDWSALATLTSDGTSLRYVDRNVTPLARYDYRLRWAEDGAEHVGGEVSVEIPAAPRLAIEAARPNPASDRAQLAFTLPVPARVRLDVLDLAGRVVISRDLDGTAGRQTLELPEVARLAAGLYVVRLEHGGNAVRSKLAVVR